MQAVLSDHVIIFLNALFLGSLFSWIAWRNGFYVLPLRTEAHEPFLIAAGDVAKVFGLFFALELIIFPLFAGAWLAFQHQEVSQLDVQTRGWLNVSVLFFSAAAIIIYTGILPDWKRQAVIWRGGTPKKMGGIGIDAMMGVIAWLLSYPLVTAVGQFVAIVLSIMGYEQQIDQVAVRHMKSVLPYPVLLSGTVLAVVFFVPLAEEILFRGFFQNWIIQKVGTWKGIALTSLLFASFHFSVSQDWMNIELLLSLFVLSCYLGFIYERQSSLWASTALHATFNAVSVVLIMN